MSTDQRDALVRRIVAALSTSDFRGAAGDLRWIAERYQQLKGEPSRERPGCSCGFDEALQRAREEWLHRVLDPASGQRGRRQRTRKQK